jgi:hypothetical protein
MTGMNINERTYSFVAHIRNQASVCANAKESQSRPICTRQTYHGLGYTGCGLSASRSTQRNILAWPVLTLCGMATCNGSARVGLLKAKAVDAEKSNPGQPCSQGASCAQGPRRMRAVRCRWCTGCSTPFVCSTQACTHLECWTRPRTSKAWICNWTLPD